MYELNYDKLSSLKALDLMASKSECVEVSLPDIDDNSSDMEVLDYIMIFVCTRLKSVKSVFKGGYVLMKIMPDMARYSHDIDFSISEKEQYELVKQVLDELGSSLVSLKVIDSYEIKDTIEHNKSGGIKLHRSGFDKQDLGIDIGLHDLSFGIQEWNILGIDVEKFTVERMLSDKISAIFSKKRFRRTKDLYDFYILTSSCKNINIDKLREFLELREINWDTTPFDPIVLREYGKAYDKLNIKNHTGKILYKPEFSECMNILKEYVAVIRGV